MVTAAALDVDESLLTGEADPIHKKPGNKNPVRQFRGRRVRGVPGHEGGAPTPTPHSWPPRHPVHAGVLGLRTGIDKILG